MGCEELIGSLRRSADEKIRLIWSEAEDEAGTLIEKFNEKRAALREEQGKTQSTASAAEADQILAAANARARMIRLSSQKALSDRLFLLMTSCLPFLRKKGYEDIFADMAREFPPLPWHRVRVNPGDVRLAKEYFIPSVPLLIPSLTPMV